MKPPMHQTFRQSRMVVSREDIKYFFYCTRCDAIDGYRSSPSLLLNPFLKFVHARKASSLRRSRHSVHVKPHQISRQFQVLWRTTLCGAQVLGFLSLTSAFLI